MAVYRAVNYLGSLCSTAPLILARVLPVCRKLFDAGRQLGANLHLAWTLCNFFTPITLLTVMFSVSKYAAQLTEFHCHVFPQKWVYWHPPAPKITHLRLCCSLQSLPSKCVTYGGDRGTVASRGELLKLQRPCCVRQGAFGTCDRVLAPHGRVCWDERGEEATGLRWHWEQCG